MHVSRQLRYAVFLSAAILGMGQILSQAQPPQATPQSAATGAGRGNRGGGGAGGLRPPAEKELIYVTLPGTLEGSWDQNGNGIVVLDARNNYNFIKRIPTWNVPASGFPEQVAGVTASPVTQMIYVAARGRLGAWDLTTEKKVWENAYDGQCCERPQISPDGSFLYVGSDLKDFWYVVNPKTGELITNALVQPGSELGWAILAGPQPLNIAQDGLKYIAFNYPAWDWRHFNPAIDIDRALAASGSWDVTSADLKPFFSRGGKLLMYHGWADPQVTPLNSVAYFNDVLQTTGAASQGKSIELYMSPGMNHCRGGEGFDTFDVIAAMEQWIATGKAPTQIPSSHLTSGVVTRTRPLCAYPQIARYTGNGSIDDAANFTCERPSHDSERQQSR